MPCMLTSPPPDADTGQQNDSGDDQQGQDHCVSLLLLVHHAREHHADAQARAGLGDPAGGQHLESPEYDDEARHRQPRLLRQETQHREQVDDAEEASGVAQGLADAAQAQQVA